jgi:hypothetical protein
MIDLKRLIRRRANVAGGANNDMGVFTPVYLNPTSREIQEIKNYGVGVKGVVNEDGNIYAWPALIIHRKLNDYLAASKDSLRVSIDDGQRFGYFPGWGWDFDENRRFNEEGAKKNIRRFKSIYEQYYPLQGETMYFYGIKDKGPGPYPHTYEEVFEDEITAGKTTLSHDIEDRNIAICIIDDKIFEGHAHAAIISDYLDQNFGVKLNNKYKRPRIFDAPNFLTDMQNDDVDNIKKHINKLAFAHRVDDGDNPGIFLETDSLYNYDERTAAFLLKHEYRGYGIYDDNDYGDDLLQYRKIAKRLIKKSEFIHCHNCGWDNGDYMYDENGKLLSWVPDPKTKKFKELENNQIYKNRKDYEDKNPEHKCPECGKQELDID